MLNFINKEDENSSGGSVAAKENNKKVIYDEAFLRNWLTAKSC